MTQRKIALSIEEAADYTGIGRNTLRQLVEWKKLPVLKVGRKVLIKTDILEMFMEANEGRDLRDRGNVKAVTRTAAQKKELLKRKKAEESKKRTHRLCQIGGAVESVLGAPIEEEDIPKLIGFLKRQEANGKFFSKAMQKEVNTDMEEV